MSEEFHTEPPVWGYASHPLLDGNRLICLVGGTNSAVVAFDRDSGKEVWRALTAKEIGYAPPVIHTINGTRQLIVWHPDAVSGLDPATGKVLWSHLYPVDGRPQRPEVTIAIPRVRGDLLFLTSFYQGALLLRIPSPGSEASVVWNRRSRKQSEKDDGLHTVMCTPLMDGKAIYGICAAGELRCLDLKTGDRRWESLEIFGGEAGFFANAFLVQQGDRCFFWNDHGELGIGKLSPDGFKLVNRAKLLEPKESTRGRDVLWCHPAFADRSAFMHNGQELIRVSLASDDV